MSDSIEEIEKMYDLKCGPGAGMIKCAMEFGLNYIDIRDFLTILIDRGKLDEFDMQVDQDTALRYLMFIKDNFTNLCEGVSLNPEFEYVELYKDHIDPHDIFYGLRAAKKD